jgi:hypothetical protein
LKVTAIIIAINEEDYLYYCLKSFYNVVDKIILVEGAEYSYHFAANSEGLSIDKMPDVIKNFPDEQKKIKWIRKGFVEHQVELRSECLKHVDLDTNILFSPDADEIYDEDELREAFKYLMAHEQIHRLIFNHIMFIEDFFHVRYELDRDGIANCWMSTVRSYRYFPDSAFTENGILISLKDGYIDAHFHLASNYHFGWMRQEERLIKKCLWTIKRHLHRKTGDYTDLKDLTDDEVVEWIKVNMNPVAKDKRFSVYRYVGKYPKVLLECILDKKAIGWKEADDKEFITI